MGAGGAAWIADGKLIEGWPERYQGTDLDVRTVVARMPRAVKDGLRYDRVPWSRFRHALGPANDVPLWLEDVRSGDADTVDRALTRLALTVCDEGRTFPAAALAVPFLIRIAAAPSMRKRASTLRVIAGAGRCLHSGTRAGLLATAYPSLQFDTWGYPANWSVDAVRDTVTTDASILLPLLDDPDPEVRCGTGYALAVASGETRPISAALRDRLRREDVPEVRASLVLGIAQLAVEEKDEPSVAAWARALWSSSTRPAEVRLAAALAWLCLVDGPVPDDLFAVLAEVATDDTARVMSRVPWINAVDGGERGLFSCLVQMLGTDARDVLGIDSPLLPSEDPPF